MLNITNQSFEQNKQQIQQTHEIINVIEQKLNRFLEKRGVRQTSPDTFKASNSKSNTSYQQNYSPERAIEYKLQQMETVMESRVVKLQQRLNQLEGENRQLAQENQQIYQENKRLKQQIRELEIAQKRKVDEELEVQRLQMQKKFEVQVNDIGENAKKRLLKTLESEDVHMNQYNRVLDEKTQLAAQLEGLRLRNRALEEERNELASSYSNLLTMHNQMLKLDVNQNQSRLMKESYTQPQRDVSLSNNKSELVDQLNQYKDELDHLKNVNENIQAHMSKELQALRSELERQKLENGDLMKEMSSMREDVTSKKEMSGQKAQKDLNDLYKHVFKSTPQLAPEIPVRGRSKEAKTVSKSKSKSKSQKRREKKIVKVPKARQASPKQSDQIEEFERELRRLKTIVNDRIISKKRKQQDTDEE